jgi:hypothetical protein
MAAPRPKPETEPQKPLHDGGVSSGETPTSPGTPSDKPDEGAADHDREGGMIGEG